MNIETLQDRIRFCAKQAGTQADLARKASLSRSQLMRYLDGESNPPISKLFDISNASGVDLAWIVTGKGSPTTCNVEEPSPYADYDLLGHVIKVFEEVLMEYPIQALTPSQKSQLLPLIFAESEHRVQRGRSSKISEQDIYDIMDYAAPLIKSGSLKFFKESVLKLFSSNPQLENDMIINNFVTTSNNAAVDFFNSPVNNYYERTKNTLSAEAKRSYLKVLETLFQHVKQPKIKMLDIGCGSGRYLLYIKEVCEKIDIKAIETADRAIHICKQFEETGKLPKDTVSKGSIMEIPFANESFDFVTSQAVMHWIPFFSDSHFGAHCAFKEVSRVLKKGGAFYLDMLNGDGSQKILPFAQTYSTEMIETLAKTHGFKIVWVHTNAIPYCEELVDPRKAGDQNFSDIIKAFLIKA